MTMSTLSNPVPWQSIPQMLRENCQRYPQAIAVIDGDTTLHYEDLAVAVEQCAGVMASHNIAKGDPVCIWAPNSWQWIICAFASWTLGAIVVPISSRLKALEVGPVLSRSRARILFTVGDCGGIDLPALLAASYGTHSSRPFDKLPDLEQLICFDQESSLANYCDFSSFVNTSTASGSATPAERLGTEDFDDCLGEILFTSGTTGEPKGVMLKQQQVLQAFWDWSDIGGLNEKDNFLVIPPFSHGFGINAGIIACVMRGMTHVVVDFFNPETALQLIKQHRISVMSGPPALFSSLAKEMLAANVDSNNETVSSLRVAYVGAAHVPEDMINSMQNDLGIDRVINAYGLIEACVVSMTRADDSNAVISTSVGRPLPNVEIKIVNDEAQALPVNQPGEILVRSYGVMQGYFEEAELTADCLSTDNWLHTGDIGTVDAEGNLTIVGRKKEMFICNGFNVYPAEVEDLLMQHPDINQAAVVGIDDQKKGEVGVAFIIRSPSGTGFDEQALNTWSKENMAGYKVPQHILVLDQFPLNDNGKVRKDELTALAIEHKNSEHIGV